MGKDRSGDRSTRQTSDPSKIPHFAPERDTPDGEFAISLWRRIEAQNKCTKPNRSRARYLHRHDVNTVLPSSRGNRDRRTSKFPTRYRKPRSSTQKAHGAGRLISRLSNSSRCQRERELTEAGYRTELKEARRPMDIGSWRMFAGVHGKHPSCQRDEIGQARASWGNKEVI